MVGKFRSLTQAQAIRNKTSVNSRLYAEGLIAEGLIVLICLRDFSANAGREIMFFDPCSSII